MPDASRSRHLVDPALLAMLDARPTVALTDANLAAVREAHRLGIVPAPEPASVTVEMRSAPGTDGSPDVPLLVYRPPGPGPFPCIYHIHPGGFVLGSAAARASVNRPLAAELGCVIVSVDYRLAPETAFPGAIEDCHAGLAWTFANAAELGIDPARVALVGESAGGGLAAALALMVRDRGDHALAFQLLVYPMLDDRTCTIAEPHPFAGEFVWTPHNNRYGWRALLGREPGGADVSPYAAPARAPDLAGLPPTFLSTGALDLFADEGMEFARRLMRAGVPSELHVYPGGFHGFDAMPTAPVAIKARADRSDALRRALAPTQY